MRTLLRSFGGLALLLALLVGTMAPASAAHNGNSKAPIAGTGDPDASGQAIVNYREGTGTFNGRITVQNLNPDTTYTFLVRGATGDTAICSAMANAQGTFTCSDQNLKLPGFGIAVVRDAAGTEVATGTFARRGNCRDPQQAGSQCNAPGQKKK
jgi:hypothetical protein